MLRMQTAFVDTTITLLAIIQRLQYTATIVLAESIAWGCKKSSAESVQWQVWLKWVRLIDFATNFLIIYYPVYYYRIVVNEN